MVSKASEDFPEPDNPVMTTNWSRGIVTSMFFKLCARAPCMTISLFFMKPHPSAFSSKIVSLNSAARSKSSAFAASFISFSSVVNSVTFSSFVNFLALCQFLYIGFRFLCDLCRTNNISDFFFDCRRRYTMFFIVRLLNIPTPLFHRSLFSWNQSSGPHT